MGHPIYLKQRMFSPRKQSLRAKQQEGDIFLQLKAMYGEIMSVYKSPGESYRLG